MCRQLADKRLAWLIVLIPFGSVVRAEPVTNSRYRPGWADVVPTRIIQHAASDGATLIKAVEALKPGDKLEIASGTYQLTRKWDIGVAGTAQSPIWIVAADKAQVIIKREDAQQNVINVGTERPVSFLCMRGLEITGGDHGLRLAQCQDVWIDQCHIHHTDEVCLGANSGNTSRLFLTSNHIHHGGGHGEGMYLGGNNATVTMSESVIALNHIHDCRGEQGDGIEVKQGSWGNVIAENHVHDTHYPCITVYGTEGRIVNVIERNLCYRSDDHCMQVQGEAIVRNNVLISSKGAAFASTDHQGKTRDLQVLHNTIINADHAFSGSSWHDRTGMVLANNVLVSRDANAINFPSGAANVIIAGNVVFGQGDKRNSALGRGLQDFVGVTWDATQRGVKPTEKALFEKAVSKYLIDTDFSGQPRAKPTSGAVTR